LLNRNVPIKHDTVHPSVRSSNMAGRRYCTVRQLSPSVDSKSAIFDRGQPSCHNSEKSSSNSKDVVSSVMNNKKLAGRGETARDAFNNRLSRQMAAQKQSRTPKTAKTVI